MAQPACTEMSSGLRTTRSKRRWSRRSQVGRVGQRPRPRPTSIPLPSPWACAGGQSLACGGFGFLASCITMPVPVIPTRSSPQTRQPAASPCIPARTLNCPTRACRQPLVLQIPRRGGVSPISYSTTYHWPTTVTPLPAHRSRLK